LRQPDAEPLPDIVKRLAAAEMSVSTDRRADWHSKRSPSQRRAVTLLKSQISNLKSQMIATRRAISLIIITTIVLLAIGWAVFHPAAEVGSAIKPSPAAARSEIISTTETQRTEKPADVQYSEAMEIDWEIQSLRNDVDRLEARMSELERQSPNTPSTKEVKP
jgi:hypothetical protein